MNFLKQLSTRYLQAAKKIGYTWMDLLKRTTRRKVINKVNEYQNKKAFNKARKVGINDAIRETNIQQMEDEVKKEHIRLIREAHIRQMKDEVERKHTKLIKQQKKVSRQKIINKVNEYQNNKKVINKARKAGIYDAIRNVQMQQMEDEIKKEHIRLIRESHIRQMEDAIKKEHNKLIKQQKQTADVLIFKRYDNDEEIPEGRKIAFRDHYGDPYVLKIRRYFIIERDANRYKGKRIYDYNDDFDRVIELLRTSEDFNEIYKTHKDYINCIIIKSLTSTNNETKANDLLDEDLFMSKEEHGVYNRYINIDLKKGEMDMQDNSCYVNIIVQRFQKAFIKLNKIRVIHLI